MTSLVSMGLFLSPAPAPAPLSTLARSMDSWWLMALKGDPTGDMCNLCRASILYTIHSIII